MDKTMLVSVDLEQGAQILGILDRSEIQGQGRALGPLFRI
jgi:hypothetical protein